MKIRTEKVIDVGEWDQLVEETYNKPYRFQQQDGCKDRGIFRFTVPNEEVDDFENDTVPEIVNHQEMGVSFAAWLKRSPNEPLAGEKPCSAKWEINLWWHRNFYPEFQMVANDLHAKGLLESGEYAIDINW